MSAPHAKTNQFSKYLPAQTLTKLILSWVVVGIFMLWGHQWLQAPIAPITAIICFIVIFSTILVAAFGVVHEADYLAHQLGEPYGTLILTLAIVSIEVILIAAVFLGPGDNATIGRDSIFAVMMIILNLVTGLCLIFGGLKHGEQEYNAQGALAYLSITVVLAAIGLILPNTLNAASGSFTPMQGLCFALITIAVYGAFLLMQTTGHRRLFIQPDRGTLSVAYTANSARNTHDKTAVIDKKGTVIHSLLLVALMLPIVLLAHDLALVIDFGIATIGAPIALGGVIIATIVFTPESITAIKAARDNQLQRSVNLCLGAFVSTVGLTIPAILTVGLVTGKPVIMGISQTETVLLMLTLGLTAFTFLGKRTTVLQGVLHLAIFAVFAVVLFTS